MLGPLSTAGDAGQQWSSVCGPLVAASDGTPGGHPTLGPGPLHPHLWLQLPSDRRFTLPTPSLRLRVRSPWHSDLLKPLVSRLFSRAQLVPFHS